MCICGVQNVQNEFVFVYGVFFVVEFFYGFFVFIDEVVVQELGDDVVFVYIGCVYDGQLVVQFIVVIIILIRQILGMEFFVICVYFI